MTPEDQPLAVAAAFFERTGRRPQGVWAAPGRVNLVGEHTDYNDGYVLPLAIDRGVVLTAARREDGALRMWSLQEDEPGLSSIDDLGPGSVKGWGAYVAGVAWAMRAAGAPIGGADIVLSGNVSPGAGLASSAALECAATLALDDLYSVGMGPEDRALLAHRAENDFVGVPCGVMDQMAATLGRAGHALFLDTRSLAYEQVPLDLAAVGLVLLVIDTGSRHALGEGQYADRRAACESAADELGLAALRDLRSEALEDAVATLDDARAGRVRHVVTENGRVLEAVDMLRAGRWADIGPLLTASHASLRKDYAVSSPELDTAVDSALLAGALGARMTGAGFGGSAIALAEMGSGEEVTTAVTAAFTERGFGTPAVFPAVASDGVHRIG